MGLFGKNKKEEIKREEAPQLFALPKLPEFPGVDEEPMQMSRFPSFPYNSLGTQFSQNTIKEAITGKEESEFSNEDANDFADEDNKRMMQEPMRKPVAEEMERRRFPTKSSEIVAPPEQVFVRIDKFEGAMEVFNETKRKISKIELALEEIKKVKEKEDRELQEWEDEIKSMKDQIEKVDRDIFSRV